MSSNRGTEPGVQSSNSVGFQRFLEFINKNAVSQDIIESYLTSQREIFNEKNPQGKTLLDILIDKINKDAASQTYERDIVRNPAMQAVARLLAGGLDATRVMQLQNDNANRNKDLFRKMIEYRDKLVTAKLQKETGAQPIQTKSPGQEFNEIMAKAISGPFDESTLNEIERFFGKSANDRFLNQKDANNQTILHYLCDQQWAAVANHDINIQNLVSYGADPFITNPQGKSSYDLGNEVARDAIKKGIHDGVTLPVATDRSKLSNHELVDLRKAAFLSWEEDIFIKESRDKESAERNRKYQQPLTMPLLSSSVQSLQQQKVAMKDHEITDPVVTTTQTKKAKTSITDNFRSMIYGATSRPKSSGEHQDKTQSVNTRLVNAVTNPKNQNVGVVLNSDAISSHQDAQALLRAETDFNKFFGKNVVSTGFKRLKLFGGTLFSDLKDFATKKADQSALYLGVAEFTLQFNISMSEIANRGLNQNNSNPTGYQPAVAHAQYMLARFAKENAKIQTGSEKTRFENDYIQALLRAKNNGHPEAMYDVAKTLAKKGKTSEAADLFVKLLEKESNGYRPDALEKIQKKAMHFVKSDSKLFKLVEEKKTHDLPSQGLRR